MSKHHAMITYWRDTAHPTGTRGLTVADDSEATVASKINRALLRFMVSDATPDEVQDDDADEEDDL